MSQAGPYFLIVGFGSIGRRHFKNLRALVPDAQVIVVRATENSRELPQGVLFMTTDLEEALAFRLAGAIIASPASAHMQTLRRLSKLDIPILLEKPLAANLAEVETLLQDEAFKTDRILVGYNFRFSRSAQLFKSLLPEVGSALQASFEMGFHLPSWRPQQDYRHSTSAQKKWGGGALLELSHGLDLYLWLFGNVTSVFARLRKVSELEIDVDDSADLLLESKSGLLSRIHLDMLQRQASRSVKVVGSAGTLTWNLVNNQILFLGPDQETRDLTLASPEAWDEMYVEEMRYFVSAIEKVKAPAATFEDGLNVMRLVEQARLSSEKSHVVHGGESFL